jgi:hypothetical protein
VKEQDDRHQFRHMEFEIEPPVVRIRGRAESEVESG